MSSIIKIQKFEEVFCMVNKEYSKEEKNTYLEDFKESGMSVSEYAREKGIPTSTLRGWLRLDRALAFGEIDLKPQFNETSNSSSKLNQPIKKTMIFAKDDIRIELKEGFDKELLKKIVEVLIGVN